MLTPKKLGRITNRIFELFKESSSQNKKALQGDKKKIGGYSFNIFRKEQIEPELWLHLQIPNEFVITASQIYDLQTCIHSQVAEIFKEKFNIDADLLICIEDGSIWIKIKPKLETLAIIITIYIGIHEVPKYISKDFNFIWQSAIPKVVRAVETVCSKGEKSKCNQYDDYFVDILEIQQYKGVVESLEETLKRYKKGTISKEQCIDEILKIFRIIYSSGGAINVAPALAKYIKAKYPKDFPLDDIIPEMQAIIRKKEEDDII